ncbi:RnfH family protein [Jeongeupia wiesaeckerbachi]|uniref:RnfH family protein n=1 Tax=Jeongeupia wiesaeckerbachi TaxID=3051218 RepID=UPI003D80A007
MSDQISVEVVFATPDKQKLVTVRLPPGATAEAAIVQSGLLDEFAEIDLTQNKVGIFGKAIKLDAVLRDRDRVEIYRPLIADPKEVRRRRVAEGKAMKKGGGEL